MPSIAFKGLTFSACGVKILKDIDFKIAGIYNLIIAQDDFLENCIRFYFTQRYVHGILVEGNILVDGAAMPADRLHLLTNQFRLFHSFESVHDALHFVDPVRATLVLTHFGTSFSNTPVGVLNIEEARIFEILLSIVANPPFIFINSLEISSSTRSQCIWLLRKYSSGSAILIASEHEDEFDGTILVMDGTMHHLSKDESREYNTEMFLSNLQLTNHRHIEQALDDEEDAPYKNRREALESFLERREKARIFKKSCGKPKSNRTTRILKNRILGGDASVSMAEYDYKGLYKQYKCENLLDLESNAYSLTERFLLFDIYRISFIQSIKIAVRKYALMIGENGRSTNLYRNLNPFIIAICILRIIREIRMEDIMADAPVLICFIYELVFTFRDWSLQAGVILFCKYVIRKPTYRRMLCILWNIFRRKCDYSEFQCMSSLVYLSIFYSNAAIFEEECGFIRFYTNRIMTPATYVLSIFIYLGITHITVFFILGMVFRVRHILGNTINAVSLNMLFACASTRRLRECAISIFLTVYLSPLFMSLSGFQEYYFKQLSSILFPPILWRDQGFNEPVHFASMIYFILFHLFVFIFCCHRISRFGQIS